MEVLGGGKGVDGEAVFTKDREGEEAVDGLGLLLQEDAGVARPIPKSPQNKDLGAGGQEAAAVPFLGRK